MDPMTARYYRAILWMDAEDLRPFPPSLLELHQWTMKRNMALGLGPNIQKTTALSVIMTWMSSTADGREFTREHTTLGDLFSEPADDAAETASAEPGSTDWQKIVTNAKVIVTMPDRSTREGLFQTCRGSWIEVIVDGHRKPFRVNKVKLVGA